MNSKFFTLVKGTPSHMHLYQLVFGKEDNLEEAFDKVVVSTAIDYSCSSPHFMTTLCDVDVTEKSLRVVCGVDVHDDVLKAGFSPDSVHATKSHWFAGKVVVLALQGFGELPLYSPKSLFTYTKLSNSDIYHVKDGGVIRCVGTWIKS